MAHSQRKSVVLPSHYAGVPLGGIGTGCLELGQDARFRNVTINNNRTAATRIPMADGAFIAVRAAVARESCTMILQPETSIPFQNAGLTPRHARPDELSWYGLYPASNYRLESNEFPLEVQWSALAPVIPYDVEASTLPLIISIVQFTNPSEEVYNVSGLFNWENLRGCTAAEWPDDRGAVERVTLTGDDEKLHAGVPSQQDVDAPPPLSTGLAFALGESCRANADGNYCLIGLPADGTRVALASWDKNDSDDVRAVWDAFEERGTLPDRMSARERAHCGAVSISLTLSPRETRRMVFLFTWYCPVYRVGSDDLGNHYATEYRSSLDVANYAVQHVKYFQKAVGNWQQRMLQSTLPNWYTRMLLNSCHVLSTNTLLTREGDFAMMESPQEPTTGVLDRSFYSSFGTLLFYPGLAERELERFAPDEDTDIQGRLYRDFGRGTTRQSRPAQGEGERLDIYPKYILMVYRNFHMTGKTVLLMNLYPVLRRAVELCLKHDRNRDGIPEVSGEATTFTGLKTDGANSYIAGLWIAALYAMHNLARHMKRPRESEQFLKLAQRAHRTYEQRLWDEEAGQYAWCANTAQSHAPHNAAACCHAGQLAGLWYADFLHLDPVFSHRRVVKALETIGTRNTRPAGLALCDQDGDDAAQPGDDVAAASYAGKGWPGFTAAFYACSQIYHRSADAGLDALKAIYQNLHVRRKRGFNQPLLWDLERNDATGPLQDRHMGALSIWHSLFALEGFWLSVPERRLVLTPRLPEGVHHLAAPLFTPAAFGWLTYHVQTKPAYRQQLTITFDSPVFIESIELAIPRSLTLPSVTILINEDPAPAEHTIVPSQPMNRLVLTLKSPLQVQHPIAITVE